MRLTMEMINTRCITTAYFKTNKTMYDILIDKAPADKQTWCG